MYKVVNVKGTVRVPPHLFDLKIKDAVKKVLQEKYERTIQPGLGLIVVVMNINNVGEGRIIPGDGASYHQTEYDLLVYAPELHEIVVGEVSQILEFGAFVTIGAFDGLVHVSQIMDDFISLDKKTMTLIGKKTKMTLKNGDKVRAKIVSVSLKDSVQDSKVGLTMRSPGLGKI